MLVKQIAVNNSLRNYMYLIVCPQTLEAAAVDPLDDAVVLQCAKENGWTITAVINTHEHHDHIGGNDAVLSATGATLYAHHKAVDKIDNVDVGLKAGDRIKIGSSVELVSLDTPGHTFCHTCLYFEGRELQGNLEACAPALFCGDTLFNAGIGNCHNGGDPQVMYQTFSEQLFLLPDETEIYPGHDYIENNLEFTLNREPDNSAAKVLLEAMKQWPNEPHFVSTIKLERLMNTFFRLKSEQVIALLKKAFPEMSDQPSEKEVFIKLRALRDRW